MKALTSLNLSFGMLNMPVRVYSMRDTKADSISFASLSPCCHKETGLQRYCKDCQNKLAWKTDLKGYKIGKEFVELTKDELATIERLDNGIEIIHYTDMSSIEQNFLDKPYFIEATGNFKLYSLFSFLFAQNNICAVAKATMKGNEHFAVLRHDKRGLVLQFIEKVTDIDISVKKGSYSEQEEKMLNTLINGSMKEFDFSSLHNTYVEKVRHLIEQKADGKTIDITAKTSTEMLDESNLLETMKAMTKQKIEVER